MYASYVTEQTWGFTCRACRHRWSITFEARHTEGTSGMDYCVWSRHGKPSMAPTAGVPCPRCAGVDVTTEATSPQTWHEVT